MFEIGQLIIADDHLGVESDRTLVDVLPVVALSRLHVDHLVMRKITTLNNITMSRMKPGHNTRRCQKGKCN